MNKKILIEISKNIIGADYTLLDTRMDTDTKVPKKKISPPKKFFSRWPSFLPFLRFFLLKSIYGEIMIIQLGLVDLVIR